MVHEFAESYDKGKAGELVLDQHFGQWWDIAPVTLDEEKARGIDRRFTKRGNPGRGTRLTVEYKTDFEVRRYKNLFLETVSVDTTGEPGWLLKSEAQALVYLMVNVSDSPGCSDFLYLDLKSLKHRALQDDWQQFPIRNSQNDGYQTKGIAVPLSVVLAEYGSLRSTVQWAIEGERIALPDPRRIVPLLRSLKLVPPPPDPRLKDPAWLKRNPLFAHHPSPRPFPLS